LKYKLKRDGSKLNSHQRRKKRRYIKRMNDLFNAGKLKQYISLVEIYTCKKQRWSKERKRLRML